MQWRIWISLTVWKPLFFYLVKISQVNHQHNSSLRSRNGGRQTDYRFHYNRKSSTIERTKDYGSRSLKTSIFYLGKNFTSCRFRWLRWGSEHLIVDVYVTSKCILLCILCIVPQCYSGMFLLCIWVMLSCHDVPIGRIYNVNKSCQVIR